MACIQPISATSPTVPASDGQTNRLLAGAFSNLFLADSLAACALALAFALCAAPVGAEDFRQGELEGSLDITLSHGVHLPRG